MKISTDTSINQFDQTTLNSMILVLTRHKHLNLIKRELGDSANTNISPSFALGIAFEAIMAVIRNNVFSQLSAPVFDMEDIDVDTIISDTGLDLYLSRENAETLVQRALWEGCLFSALDVDQATYTPDDLVLFGTLAHMYGFKKVKWIYRRALKTERVSNCPEVPSQEAVRQARLHFMRKGRL